nr:uncharacterized protein CI109_006686 [Kwoniella shandongensis]KAA5524962.1 hypothetical protein CI109_006686 [Kwoniella shandongensis]
MQLDNEPPRPDDQSLEAWREFLETYANGAIPSDHIPPLPLLSSSPSTTTTSESSFHDYEQDDTIGSDFDHPIYDCTEISPVTAYRVREFYRRNRFLPPPRAPEENLREQIIQEYDLYSDKQVKNIQSAMDLVQAFFGGICTFTLFRDNIQELVACAGHPEIFESRGLVRGTRLLPETSLCGHSVLCNDPNKTNYIPSLEDDWRYRCNPYAIDKASGGIKSYLGSVVSLKVDPASTSTDDRVVSVGVINSMHFDYLPPLNEQQQMVLGHVKGMLETQLRATWEGHERTREARAQRAVSSFIESTLVDSTLKLAHVNPPPSESQTVANGLPPVLEPIAKEVPSLGENPKQGSETKVDALHASAHLAAKHIKTVLTEMDNVTIVDLRSLHPVKDKAGKTSFVPTNDSNLPLTVLASESKDPNTPSSRLRNSDASMAIIQYLNRHSNQAIASFDDKTEASGLETYLPPNTRLHIVMPYLTGDQPLFMFILTTIRVAYPLKARRVGFLSSIGGVLRAQILQARVIEADAAKTAFLSSISHELRTPMHGVLSGLQLVREAVTDEDLGEVERLLTMTESSGYALQHILNDVLDFGSIANGKNGATRRSLTDLARATLSAAKTCSRGMAPVVDGSKVDLIVELEDRDWRAIVDEPGFQRILFNGLTNALKFTKAGRITLSLTSSPDNHNIVIRVLDTGPGIDPKFAAKVFEPFTKADTFTPGAGLGLYITKSLADRMGGTVTLTSRPEGGAAFTVVLPVELLGTRPATIRTTRHAVENEVVRSYSSDGDLSEIPVRTRKSLRDLSIVEQVDAVLPETPTVDTDPAEVEATAIRVLVADDNYIGRKILLTLLDQIARKQPVVSAQAVDGVEAVEKFKEFQPDLVLTDVSMPRMDGVTAASEMRDVETGKTWSRPRCRIFAITGLGSSDPRMKMDALKGSAALDGWLIKGQDKLSKIREIVSDVRQSRQVTL